MPTMERGPAWRKTFRISGQPCSAMAKGHTASHPPMAKRRYRSPPHPPTRLPLFRFPLAMFRPGPGNRTPPGQKPRFQGLAPSLTPASRIGSTSRLHESAPHGSRFGRGVGGGSPNVKQNNGLRPNPTHASKPNIVKEQFRWRSVCWLACQSVSQSVHGCHAPAGRRMDRASCRSAEGGGGGGM